MNSLTFTFVKCICIPFIELKVSDRGRDMHVNCHLVLVRDAIARKPGDRLLAMTRYLGTYESGHFV
jgi:hypothetical protein